MKPGKASSIWPEMPFMRGPQGAHRLREWLTTQHTIRAQAAARRDQILRHEWAKKQLEHILQISKAERWTGYIPDHGHGNQTPAAQALVDLLRDVANFDRNQSLEE